MASNDAFKKGAIVLAFYKNRQIQGYYPALVYNSDKAVDFCFFDVKVTGTKLESDLRTLDFDVAPEVEGMTEARFWKRVPIHERVTCFFYVNKGKGPKVERSTLTADQLNIIESYESFKKTGQELTPITLEEKAFAHNQKSINLFQRAIEKLNLVVGNQQHEFVELQREFDGYKINAEGEKRDLRFTLSLLQDELSKLQYIVFAKDATIEKLQEKLSRYENAHLMNLSRQTSTDEH